MRRRNVVESVATNCRRKGALDILTRLSSWHSRSRDESAAGLYAPRRRLTTQLAVATASCPTGQLFAVFTYLLCCSTETGLYQTRLGHFLALFD